MEGPPLGPGGEDITWPDQVAPRGRKASSTRKIEPQTSNLNSILTFTSDSCISKPARYKHMVRHTKGTYIVAKYAYFMAAYPAVVLAVARTHRAASSATSNLGRACSNAHTPGIARTHSNYSRLTRRIEGAGCPLHARTQARGAFGTHHCRQTHSHAHAWSLAHRQITTAGAGTQTPGVHNTRTQFSADSSPTQMT